KGVPELDGRALSQLLGQTVTFEDRPQQFLVRVADPKLVRSELRTEAGSTDSTLDNELNVLTESVAYLRYRRQADPSYVWRDLLIVPASMGPFYLSALNGNLGAKVAGWIDAKVGRLAAIDTR